MSTDERIELGEENAESDKLLEDHLVFTKYLGRIHTSESDIVLGSKGVGKSALRLAVSEFKKDTYYHTKTIDLQSLSFSAIHEKLSQISSTIKIETPHIASAAWKDILANYALLAMKEAPGTSSTLRLRIDAVLKEEGFFQAGMIVDKKSAHRQVLNTIERIIHRISTLPLSSDSSSSDLSPDQQNVSNEFPANEKLRIVLMDSVKEICVSKKKLLVCLDGFDSIVSHSSEARQAIFVGLIDAIFQLRLDARLKEAFCFKAFLPQEMTVDAIAISWDFDKHARRVHYVRWNERDFKTFIERRLTGYARSKSQRFADIWAEFMPERIVNPYHEVEENTFEYILRHTLFRPRQVMSHVQRVFDRWYEHNGGIGKVDPSFIPQIVADNNQEQALFVANQLDTTYPGMKNFLRSWRNHPTTFDVGTLRNRIKKHFPEAEPELIHKYVEELLQFGIIGVRSASERPRHQTKKIEFKFASIDDGSGGHRELGVNDEAVIAFAPMFKEYCALLPCDDGIIQPISSAND